MYSDSELRKLPIIMRKNMICSPYEWKSFCSWLTAKASFVTYYHGFVQASGMTEVTTVEPDNHVKRFFCEQVHLEFPLFITLGEWALRWIQGYASHVIKMTMNLLVCRACIWALVVCLGHLMSKYGHKLCPLLNMPKTDIRSSKNRHKPSRIIHIIHTAGQRSSTPLLCELQAPQACKKCR